MSGGIAEFDKYKYKGSFTNIDRNFNAIIAPAAQSRGDSGKVAAGSAIRDKDRTKKQKTNGKIKTTKTRKMQRQKSKDNRQIQRQIQKT